MAGVSVDQAKAMMRDDIKGMRAEYTRMRDIAQKRINRLGKSEFAYTKAYTGHQRGFQKLKDISPEKFAKAYSELSKFVGAKASSVSGQRSIMNKTIETWNKQGIPLTKKTYKRTITILEEMRKRKIIYGSDTAEELARITLELTDNEFYEFYEDIINNLEFYLMHTRELEDYLEEKRDPYTGYKMVDMDEFKELVGW